MRSKPEAAAPAWPERPPRAQQEIDLELDVVTPMFGGGYEARTFDAACPIHSAAVRGHLRFWWRACVGGRFHSAEELYNAEAAVWGSAQQAGAVVVRVSDVDPGHEAFLEEYAPKMFSTLGYALFPFREEQRGGQSAAIGRKGVHFNLHVSGPDTAMKEVESAVRAWVRFGGIGSRTRRGCGSLGIANGGLPPAFADEDASAEAGEIPLLNGVRAMTLERNFSDPVKAWEEAIKLYRDFRQGPGFARNRGQGPRPGRSFWPEPDSIRRITGQHSSGHEPTHSIQSGFPRADLGLPIVFHFVGQGEPRDATLNGPHKGISRMASPVISKALWLGPNQFVPLILVLNAPHAWRFGPLELAGANTSVPQAQIELTPAERLKIGPLKGESPREALLKYARASGWTAWKGSW